VNEAEELIVRFNESSSYDKKNEIAEKMLKITQRTYDNISEKYHEVRGIELNEIDQFSWDNLESYIHTYIHHDPYNSIRMLDVATGTGRDIMYANAIGFKVIGVDNSDGVISILEKLKDERKIPTGSFAKCDMRDLPFDDGSFDVVRHNSSLLHMPIIAEGYGADRAISEANRVLVRGGLLQVAVKKGDGLEYVDTGEGLGGRIFQFYNHKMMNEILTRNGFTIVYTSDLVDKRPSGDIEFISVIAQKD